MSALSVPYVMVNDLLVRATSHRDESLGSLRDFYSAEIVAYENVLAVLKGCMVKEECKK